MLLSLYLQGLAETRSMAINSQWQKRSPGSLISSVFASICCLHPGYGQRRSVVLLSLQFQGLDEGWKKKVDGGKEAEAV